MEKILKITKQNKRIVYYSPSNKITIKAENNLLLWNLNIYPTYIPKLRVEEKTTVLHVINVALTL
jgi:hypothetical protein